jgi:hypothetical protein
VAEQRGVSLASSHVPVCQRVALQALLVERLSGVLSEQGEAQFAVR